MHSVSKQVRLSARSMMKIDLHFQRRRCSPMTLVSGNTFNGIHGRGGVKRQRDNQKHGFIRLSMIRLQPLIRNEANVII